MAEIKFTAFVNEWKKDSSDRHPKWAMKTAETHRKKDGEKWITTATTYRTVKLGFGVDIDLTQFSPGDRVVVVGNEITEMWESNGRKGNTLVVKADSVSFADRGGIAYTPPVGTSENVDGFDLNAPF